MGAADRLALGGAGRERGLVELVAELLQRLRHPVRASLAVLAVGLQALQQVRVGVIDHVPKDVEVVPGLVERRDLDRGHDPDAEPAGCVDRLLDAVDAVVIAQRHQLDAGRGGGLDDLASRERPVGMDGMTLKVESGRIG